MGGTVTQSRSWPDKRVVNWIDGVPAVAVDLSLHLGTSAQSTTSFRTGRGVPDGGHDDEDLELLSSKNYQDVRKALYSQKKRSDASKFDNGHPFYTELKTQSHPEIDVTVEVPDVPVNQFHRYAGPIVIRPAGGGPISGGWSLPPAFDAVYYGTKAIAETAPTRPALSLVTALAELAREGLPGLVGATLLTDRNPAAIGSEYLNGEFGYLPLADDIAMAAYNVSESERLILQYTRDSGRQVRRSMTFDVPKEISRSTYAAECTTLSNTSSTALWGIIGGGGARYTYGAGQVVDVTQKSYRVYFKGAYMYHLPIDKTSFGAIERAASKANNLLGLELTPEVLYNLAPWSWLVDWKINLGDVISNISSFQTDSLVLRYGYIMRETKTTRDMTFTLDPTWARAHSSYNVPRVFTQTYTFTSKERVKASPYGFALNPSAYTPRKWAILAALGLTKAADILP